MFATNIKWDIDLEEGENYESARKELKLPKEVELPKRFWPENGVTADNEEVAGWLSDEYGYCVVEFDVAG